MIGAAMKIIEVKVKPNARVSTLEQLSDGTFVAHVKALPVEGKANAELVALVARHFDRRKSQVAVRSGASGRLKRVQIDDE